jgi:hypothetical protein
MPFVSRPIEERFNEKYIINHKTGCWEWTASKNKDGYGKFDKTTAHRMSYQLHIGEIPEGKFVCHHCDIPSCVNPEHLWIGTAEENSLDARLKGRMPIAPHPSSKSYQDGCRCDLCVAFESERGKQTYQKNKERILARNRANYQKNKDKITARIKKYKQDNIEKFRKYDREYKAKKLQEKKSGINRT